MDDSGLILIEYAFSANTRFGIISPPLNQTRKAWPVTRMAKQEWNPKKPRGEKVINTLIRWTYAGEKWEFCVSEQSYGFHFLQIRLTITRLPKKMGNTQINISSDDSANTERENSFFIVFLYRKKSCEVWDKF